MFEKKKFINKIFINKQISMKIRHSISKFYKLLIFIKLKKLARHIKMTSLIKLFF